MGGTRASACARRSDAGAAFHGDVEQGHARGPRSGRDRVLQPVTAEMAARAALVVVALASVVGIVRVSGIACAVVRRPGTVLRRSNRRVKRARARKQGTHVAAAQRNEGAHPQRDGASGEAREA